MKFCIVRPVECSCKTGCKYYEEKTSSNKNKKAK